MKKILAVCAIITIVVLNSLSSQAQTSKKTENARKEVRKAETKLKEAKQDLQEARLDSTADYIAFRKNALLQIESNNNAIEKLSIRKTDASKEIQKKFDLEVSRLRVENMKLQHDINESQSLLKSSWEHFKLDFTKEMVELGHSIKKLTGNDVE